MIGRRAFTLALASPALAARAAAQARRPLLAVLSPSYPDAHVVVNLVNAPFRQALARLGWEAGRNLDIAERFAEGDESRLPALAAELVALRPGVIFTNTSNAATIAARATRTIPIVVGPAGETTLIELAGGSLARPTTNVTGFVLTSAEIDDKVVLLLMEAAPAANRIGVLVNPNNPVHAAYPALLKSAQAMGGKSLIRLETRGIGDIDAAMAKAAAERVEAVFVADDAQIAARPDVRARVLRFAGEAGIPVASSHIDFARQGALFAMGPSIPALAAAAAGYVDRILKGAKPADLPIERPVILTSIVNLKTAKGLGLDVPAAVLARADEVIE